MSVRVIVVREVETAKLLGVPVKRFLGKAMRHVHHHIHRRTPWDTGNLQGALQPGSGVTRVLDDSAIVGVAGVLSKKGANAQDYGLALHKPVKRNPRYRATAWAGKKTRSWFDKGIEDATPGLADKVVPELARDIEAAWRA